jgi:hypothetical protein
MPEGRTAPDWLWQLQADLFARVEAPVATLWPGLSGPELKLLSRSVFSAVHGVITLGLDQRLANIDTDNLRQQLRLVVTALGTGLAHKPTAPRSATTRRGWSER